MYQLLIFATVLHSVVGLIGYDCGSKILNITTLSLLDVGPCDIPQVAPNVTRKYIQLLQINDYLETEVIQCKLEVYRTIYYCGMHSHVSVVHQGAGEYIQEISSKQCENLFHTGYLRLGNSVFNGIKVNNTIAYPMTFAGSIKNDGSCQGAAYMDPYGSWESVVVQGTIRVTVQSQKARVDINNNKIHLSSGTSCTLSDSTCIDVEGGPTFWKAIPVDNCKFDHYSFLYEGYANKIVDYFGEQDSIVYSLTTQDITFALTSKAEESVCGYKIIRTEHPKLVIFETVKGESFVKPEKIAISNLDIFAYVNSKFVYVEKHVRSQIGYLYQDVVIQRCNLERETLKNALAIATQAPDQFAYNLMKGPGYMAVAAGEVVHIVKCVPVEVKVEHGEECFAELQVTRQNRTYYMTPRTHILKDHGISVSCNALLPAYYSLGTEWYKILPRPTETKAPVEISPKSKATWRYISPDYLATTGIYSEKDIEQLKQHIMFPVERPGYLNDIAREMHGLPITDHSGTILKLLNKEAVEIIIQSTWDRAWTKFMAFGTASAGIIAILMIFQIIKMIIEILINGFLLHKVYGWSIHLLAAIWSSLAHMLVYLNKDPRENEPQVDIEQPIEPERELLTPPQPTNSVPTTSKDKIETTDLNPTSGFFTLK